MKLIDISTIKHPEIFTRVDDFNYDFLNKFRWHAWIAKCGLVYAIRTFRIKVTGKYSAIKLHRFIFCSHFGDNKNFVDHIDGDSLNNQISNLRIVTPQQSAWNRKIQNISGAKYKGIEIKKYKNSVYYRARITFNKKEYRLGSFKTQEEAALAYNDAAIKYYGEYARLNNILSEKNQEATP